MTSDQIIMRDARNVDHPLHSWADSLIGLLLQWKSEMEMFELKLNGILRGIHDVYYEQLSFGCWINSEKAKSTPRGPWNFPDIGVAHLPHLEPLEDELAAESEGLFDAYYYLQQVCIVEDDETKIRDFIATCNQNVTDLKRAAPPSVLEFLRDCEYAKMKFIDYRETPLVKWTKVFPGTYMSALEHLE